MRSADFAPITSPIMTSGPAPKKRAHGGSAPKHPPARAPGKHPLALTIIMPAPMPAPIAPAAQLNHQAALGALMHALILHQLAVRGAHAIGLHQGALARTAGPSAR